MKIYSVFNSRKELLSNFSSENNLFEYIRRHKRDENDTTILVTELDSWNELDAIIDDTRTLCQLAYRKIE